MNDIRWWNDTSIKVVNIDGHYIALNGWRGRYFEDCWEVAEVLGGLAYGVLQEKIVVEPETLYWNGEVHNYNIVDNSSIRYA